jgi:hypothetical protein
VEARLRDADEGGQLELAQRDVDPDTLGARSTVGLGFRYPLAVQRKPRPLSGQVRLASTSADFR